MRALLLSLLLACAGEQPPDEEIACSTEPTGLAVGTVVEDLAFQDCDGSEVGFRDLCGRPTLVMNWYGWCPPCESHAALARELAAEYPELQSVIVLNEDPLNAPADPELCELYVDTYPSDAKVWIDPEDHLEIYGTTDLVLVIDRDGTLLFYRDSATDDAIREAVAGAVAR